VGQIVLAETFGAGLVPYGADIHELTLVVGPSGLRLEGFAGDGLSARLVAFTLDGGARFQGESFLGPTHDGFLAADFGTRDYHLSLDRMAGELAAGPGDARVALSISDLNNGFAGDTLRLVGAATGRANVIVTSQPNMAGLSVARVTGDGLSAFTALAGAGEGRISDLATLNVHGQGWILASSSDNDSVISYSLSAEGEVSYTAEFGAAQGLGIGDAMVLRTAVVDGQPYVLVAGAESNSISVLSLEPDGSFRAVDHVLDSLNTRFAGIVRLEVTEIDGASYVVAAGSDDGFSLFRLRPDGKLLHLGAVADDAGVVLDNPAALALAGHDGKLHITVASGTEAGISHFTYDLTNQGQTLIGGSAGETLVGTAGNDMILGASGDDTVSGGAGDDVLIDGAGCDILIGGPGRDLFVFHADGEVDTIADFERGIDQLDLSFFHGFYSLDQATVLTTSDGARLIFGDEVIIIRAADGNPLTRADLGRHPAFNLDRPPIVLNHDPVPNTGLIAGGADDDMLVGTAGSETLSGGLGNDVLQGGAGADRLFGGGGHDAASYVMSASGVLVDLLNPDANTGDAAGDRYYSIEAIIGTGSDDILRGDDTRNDLRGGAGNDRLEGRGGDDLLYGGDGDDWLSGGAGADLLDGGAGVDIASYADAGAGVRADLGAPQKNTRDAAGDIHTSIEGLQGSDFADLLYGDDADNRLSGGAGNDRLFGRAGDDTLTGGAGRDFLHGGPGMDTVSYADAEAGVQVRLDRDRGTGGDAAGDRYKSIERVEGSEFDDRLIGSKRPNQMSGGDGDDVLAGKNRSDHLDGGAGNDRLVGGDGGDLLDGGAGDDVLLGGKGNDRLIGGAGDDYMVGGKGLDTFVFAPDFGNDRIAGFNARYDRLEFDPAVFGAVPVSADAFVTDHVRQVGGDTVLDFDDGNSLTLLDYGNHFALYDALIFA